MGTTALAIFLAAALKGVIMVVLHKKGWWSYEAALQKRLEHKRVLAAYDEWRKDRGPHAPSDTTLDLLPTDTRRLPGDKLV